MNTGRGTIPRLMKGKAAELGRTLLRYLKSC